MFRGILYRKHKYFSDKAFVENFQPTIVDDNNIEKVKEIVLDNRRFGIKKMAQVFNINNLLNELKAIVYKKCIENCINRWHACVGSKGPILKVIIQIYIKIHKNVAF